MPSRKYSMPRSRSQVKDITMKLCCKLIQAINIRLWCTSSQSRAIHRSSATNKLTHNTMYPARNPSSWSNRTSTLNHQMRTCWRYSNSLNRDSRACSVHPMLSMCTGHTSIDSILSSIGLGSGPMRATSTRYPSSYHPNLQTLL